MKKIITLVLLTVIISFSTFTGAESNGREARIKISAIGDLVMHIPVKMSAKMHNKIKDGKSINNNGFDYLFAPTKPIFKQHDVTIANMEFPVVHPFDSRAFNFNCEPEIIPAMLQSGINMVTVANNHTYDKGVNGLIETLERLENAGMKYVGAGITEESARKGLIVTKDGIQIGLLGYTGVFNIRLNKADPQKPRVNDFNDEQKVIEDIKRLKKNVDFLIINVHWGTEYTTLPREKERRLAQLYADAGADLIIGHHPHVLQYVERFNTKDGRSCLVVYSLGNFISNQAYYYTPAHPVHKGRERDSVILSLEIAKKPRAGLYPDEQGRNTVFLKSATFIPIWTINRRVRINNRNVIQIRTYPIYRLIEKINLQIQNNTGNSQLLKSEKKMLQKRLEDIQRVLFLKGKPDNVIFEEPGTQL